MAQDYRTTRWNLEQFRGEDGKLIHNVDGGYPVYYLDGEDNVLCPDCANESEAENEAGHEYRPIAGDVHYEGPDILCDQDNAHVIESAYGDPDSKEEEIYVYDT